MPVIIALILIAAIYLFGSVQMTGTDRPPAPTPQIDKMALAIANAEGSPADWNNPGDLTIAFGYPTLGTMNSAGVLKFATSADGWNALYHQLSLIVSGGSRYTLSDTIGTFGNGYSGGDPNWAVNVANYLGVTTDTPLGDVLA